MKNFRVFFLAILFALVNSINIFAITDDKIFTDTVYNTYEGTKDAKPLINNLKFTDVSNDYWAKEAITKAGALNIVKGYENTYNPNSNVSNQEALAFVIRVIGLEDEAQAEGVRLQDQASSNNSLSIWSIGYLSLARTHGLITTEQYDQAIVIDQDSLADDAFKRSAPATREQVVTWVIQALNMIRTTPLVSENQQSIYNYSDWQSISIEHIDNMEIALDNGIIKGSDNGKLNPKGYLTRAEIAQILVNLDSLYNEAVGLTKKSGTVGGIKDNQTTQTGQANLERNIYIRTSNGTVDILKYAIESSDSPQSTTEDAVVYNAGAVTGLGSLREGSQIEYLVDDVNKIVYFVSVKDTTVNVAEANGKLSKVDFENGMIQIKDSNEKTFNYYTVDGILGSDDNGNYVYMSGKRQKEKDLPIGSMVKLDLKNNIVTKITYVGDATLTQEIRGVVIENNTEFSYITILDENGKEVTKNYFPDEVEVEKQPYYQNGDDIGYFDQMFPNFEYDPRDTTIDKIEAGDIVFITPREDDPTYIDRISASTNYTTKYGKVSQVTNGTDIVNMLIEFSDGQTAWYEIPYSIYVSKSGKPVSISEVKVGDWIKFLVNEAILSPGEVIESVKEIVIEDSGHIIGDILRGQIGNIDTIQKTISLQHSYVLGKSGWEDYKQIRQLSLANSDIMYYYNDQQVSLDFVQRYLKHSDGEAYVALEENYAGNIISKITFRTGRDELLETDTVVSVDGVGGFVTAGNQTIKTDTGTIVRKNGNLVNAINISVNDYVRISLNGDGKAGIIDIYDAPVSNSIYIARARVKEIEPNRYFVVESMSILNGNEWQYSPIERKFTIDPSSTIYIGEDGIRNISEFIGYTENTSIGKAFTILYDGDKATHIIDNNYATNLVSGLVYETGNTIQVRDAKYMKDDNTWDTISNKDATMSIETQNNTIVIKNNQVTSVSSIQQGDKIKVFTDKIPDKITSGMSVNARIIFVEN